MTDAWRSMTACELGRGIGAGEIDPAALTEAFLGAIAAHPDADRVYARLTPARARVEAAAASERARLGVRRGLLDGVPISWKDLFDVAGEETHAGSAMLAGRGPAQADAEALARATRAGTVCLGKTHMTELAFSGLGVNPVTATAPNVHNADGRDWAPGGSSSGAAASTALGLAAAGIGSDTGGSVRLPAAFQDLVGLKTTLGLIPVDGSVPLSAFLDTVGPLCRSVEDAAEITAVLADAPAPDLSGANLAGVRLLVDEATMLDGAEEAPARAFEEAVRRLEAAGVEIGRRDVPEFAEALPTTLQVLVGEAWAEHGELVEEKGDLMFHQIRKRIEAGRGISAADYLRTMKRLMGLRASYLERIGGFDAVLAPTATIEPPSVSRLLSDDAYYERVNLVALRNTRISNQLGLCALTLPTGVPGCGAMLMGRPFGEAALLRVGAAAEAALAD